MSEYLKKSKTVNLDSTFAIPDFLNLTRYASLDGIRAICIMLVVGAHLSNAYKINESTRSVITQIGLLGVQIFFVLSGFLITTLLLKEKSSNGNINLKDFYFRRVLRILPVAFLYLIFVFVLNFIFHLNIPGNCFFGAIFFLANLSYFHGSWYTAHFWSLSIEEQYYLLFPILLKKFTNKIEYILGTILLIIIIVKWFPLEIENIIVKWFSLSIENKSLILIFELIYHSDAVLTGSLLSVFCFKYKFLIRFIDKYKRFLFLPAFIIIALLQTNFIVLYSLNSTIVSFLIGMLLIICMHPSDNLFYQLLNTRMMMVIGKLSFSIYIWQQLFTSTDGKFGFFSRLPVNLILLIIVSSASYYLFERKFLVIKEKLRSSRIKKKSIETQLSI